jgi:hypothetical protein
MAADYLARHHLIAVPCRFDVVTVDDAGGAPVVTLFENAFGAG